MLTSAALYREHARRVSAWAARLTNYRHAADVEDMVQEVFLRAHRALGTFRGESEVTTWLYRITLNVVRMQMRKARSRSTCELDDEIPSPCPSPESNCEHEERVQLLREALESIPASQRHVLVLFELEGHSGEEIAKLFNVKISTLWVRLSRARKTVTDALSSAHEPHDFESDG